MGAISFNCAACTETITASDRIIHKASEEGQTVCPCCETYLHISKDGDNYKSVEYTEHLKRIRSIIQRFNTRNNEILATQL